MGRIARRILKFSAFLSTVFSTVILCKLDFDSRFSSIRVLPGATLTVKNPISNFTGTFKRYPGGIVTGETITFNEGLFEDHGNELLLSAVFDPSGYIVMSGDDSVRAAAGRVLQSVLISGDNNRLEGSPVFNQDVILQDVSSSVTFAVQSQVSQDVVLNGGSIWIEDDLHFFDGKFLLGDGTIKGCGCRVITGSEPFTIDSETQWNNCSNLEIRADDITLNGSMRFSGITSINGNGGVLDLSKGGRIIVAAGATLHLTDLVIKGLSDEPESGSWGKIIFEDENSSIRTSRVDFEIDHNVTTTMGGIYVKSPGTWIIKNYTWTFDYLSSVTVDGVTVWKDNAGEVTFGDVVFGSPEENHLTLISSGTLKFLCCDGGTSKLQSRVEILESCCEDVGTRIEVLESCCDAVKTSTGELISIIDTMGSCCEGITSRIEILESCCDDVGTRIEVLESCCDSVKTSTGELISIIDTLDTVTIVQEIYSRMEILETCCEGVTSRIEILESCCEDVGTRIEVLESCCDSVKTSTGELISIIDTLSSCCDGVYSKIEILESCCDEVRTSTGELQSQLDECCDNIHTITCETTIVARCEAGPLIRATYEDADVQSVSWTFDDRFIAIGLGAKPDVPLRIYEFDGSFLTLRAEDPLGTNSNVHIVRWHPSKNLLALGRAGIADANAELIIFEFDPVSYTLTQKSSKNFNYDVYAVAWHPSGDYLAVGGYNYSAELELYSVDSSGVLSASPVDVVDLSPNREVRKEAMDWAVDGNHLVIGTKYTSGATSAIVFRFNDTAETLTESAGYDFGQSVNSVDWNPTYTGFISAGIAGGQKRLIILEYDEDAETLVKRLEYGNDLGPSPAVYSTHWGPCGFCLSVGWEESSSSEKIEEFITLSFDPVNMTLTPISLYNFAEEVEAVRWAHSGNYIAVGSDIDQMRVYAAQCGEAITICGLVSRIQALESCCEEVGTRIEVLESCCDAVKTSTGELISIIDTLGSCCEGVTSRIEILESCCEDVGTRIEVLESCCDAVKTSTGELISIIDTLGSCCEGVTSRIEILESCCEDVGTRIEVLESCCDAVKTSTGELISIIDTLGSCCEGVTSRIEILESCCEGVTSRIEILESCCEDVGTRIEVLESCCDSVRTSTGELISIIDTLGSCCEGVTSRIEILESCCEDVGTRIEVLESCCDSVRTSTGELISIIDTLGSCCEGVTSRIEILESCCEDVGSRVEILESCCEDIGTRIEVLESCCDSVRTSTGELISIIDSLDTVTITREIYSRIEVLETCCEVVNTRIEILESCCEDVGSRVEILESCCEEVGSRIEYLESCCEEMSTCTCCCPGEKCWVGEVVTFTTESEDVQSVDWSYDDKFTIMGLGGTSPANPIKIYEFDGTSILQRVASPLDDPTEIFCVRWHPYDYFFAIGRPAIAGTKPELMVYEFNPTLNTITQTSSKDFDYDVSAVAWHPSGNYLAIGGDHPTGEIKVYSVDASGVLSASPVATADISPERGISQEAIGWSVDGSYLAVGTKELEGAGELIVYRFQTGESTSLIENASYPLCGAINDVDWNHTYTGFIAVARDGCFAQGLAIFEHDADAGTLGLKIEYGDGGGEICPLGPSAYSVHWGTCGDCLSVGWEHSTESENTEEFQTFEFSRTALTVTLIHSVSFGDDIEAVRWSRDSKHIAIGGDIDQMRIYPSRCNECQEVWICDLLSRIEDLESCCEDVGTRIEVLESCCDSVKTSTGELISIIDTLGSCCEGVTSRIEILESCCEDVGTRIEVLESCCDSVKTSTGELISIIDTLDTVTIVREIYSRIEILETCCEGASTKIEILESCCEDVGSRIEYLESCCEEMSTCTCCCPGEKCWVGEVVTFTTESDNVQSVDWSYDDKFTIMGLGGISPANPIKIYEFDGTDLAQKVASPLDDPTEIFCVRWHPSDYFFAVGRPAIAGTKPELMVYEFNPTLNTITQISSKDFDYDVSAVAWHPSGNYLAVGTDDPSGEVKIYSVDASGVLSSSPVATANISPDRGVNHEAIGWSIDGGYLSVGTKDSAGVSELIVYTFYTHEGIALVENASYSLSLAVNDVDWNHTYTGFLAVARVGCNNRGLAIFEHDADAGTLNLRIEYGDGSGECPYGPTAYSVHWGDCGDCLSVGWQYLSESIGIGEFQTFEFDRLGLSLTSANALRFNDNIEAVRWSRDSKHIAIGGDIDQMRIYPSRCNECQEVWICDLLSRIEGLESCCEEVGSKIEVLESCCDSVRTSTGELISIIDTLGSCCEGVSTKIEILESCCEDVGTRIEILESCCEDVGSRVEILETCCEGVSTKIEILESCCEDVGSRVEILETCCEGVSTKIEVLESCCEDVGSRIEILESCCEGVSTKIEILESCCEDVGSRVEILETCCEGVSTKIEILESCCEDVGTRIEILESCCEDVGSRIEILETCCEGVSTKIEVLESCCEDVGSRIEILESCCEDVGSRVEILETCCEGVSTKIEVLESCCEDVGSRIEILESCCEGVSTKIEILESCCEDVGSRIEILETCCEGVSTKIEVLESCCDAVKTSTGELQSQIDECCRCCVDCIYSITAPDTYFIPAILPEMLPEENTAVVFRFEPCWGDENVPRLIFDANNLPGGEVDLTRASRMIFQGEGIVELRNGVIFNFGNQLLKADWPHVIVEERAMMMPVEDAVVSFRGRAKVKVRDAGMIWLNEPSKMIFGVSETDEFDINVDAVGSVIVDNPGARITFQRSIFDIVFSRSSLLSILDGRVEFNSNDGVYEPGTLSSLKFSEAANLEVRRPGGLLRLSPNLDDSLVNFDNRTGVIDGGGHKVYGSGSVQFIDFDNGINTTLRLQENFFQAEDTIVELFLEIALVLKSGESIVSPSDIDILVHLSDEEQTLAAIDPRRTGSVLELEKGDHDVAYESVDQFGQGQFPIIGRDQSGRFFEIDQNGGRTTIV